MPSFSVLSNLTVMGTHVSCFNPSLFPNNGEKLKLQLRKIQSLEKYRRLSAAGSLSDNCSKSVSFLSRSCFCKSQSGSQSCKGIRSRIDGNSEKIKTLMRSGENRRLRRRFSLRLRPRLRLLSVRMKWVAMKLKEASLQGILEAIGVSLRKNFKRVTISTSVSVGLGLFYLFLKLTAVPSSKVVPYSDLITNLQGGQVSKVLFEEGSRRIFYNMPQNTENSAAESDENSSSVGNNLVPTRARASAPEWEYCTRKIDHDEIFCANSPAKKRRPSNQTVGFDDVEGVDAAKTELMEIVSCLRGAINYNKLGAKLPRGVLLVGPPGTGKTLLARAVAGEAGVPFFTVSASEFVELFVGRGAARIRDLFSVARKCTPSIIFIDELDAVGGKRGRSFNDERDQTLNQLLTEMDGFESDTKVVVIAATNRPEALDPALCRPGRFSRKVFVGEPDFDGRKKILAIHLRGVPLEEDSQLICNLVASLTPGFVGADLANIVNEAALLAARRGGEVVIREDIMAAIERAKFGINDRQFTPSTIGKELGKLFSWMPSQVRSNDPRGDGMGYQTLS
ncbi:AAA+ ATPase domain-containing protein [Cinnamomum micranthum f. kanehirae]|uniref:AAA+ ATPase domain-containing protein n=1 Tax=Cinnamomum micranthum f. kanehirae TaxID=337451 RepID=A0A443NEV2_9MAGN|nr:AAA+ ATPase domain-containing protein [Cinnamomum micranthum f. kanehirae]